MILKNGPISVLVTLRYPAATDAVGVQSIEADVDGEPFESEISTNAFEFSEAAVNAAGTTVGVLLV
jgi:hypothetical protein